MMMCYNSLEYTAVLCTCNKNAQAKGGIQMDLIKSIENEQLKSELTPFNVGDTIKVHVKIKEGNRERIQVFEGIVIKRQGESNRATFTVRKIFTFVS